MKHPYRVSNLAANLGPRNLVWIGAITNSAALTACIFMHVEPNGDYPLSLSSSKLDKMVKLVNAINMNRLQEPALRQPDRLRALWGITSRRGRAYMPFFPGAPPRLPRLYPSRARSLMQVVVYIVRGSGAVTDYKTIGIGGKNALQTVKQTSWE